MLTIFESPYTFYTAGLHESIENGWGWMVFRDPCEINDTSQGVSIV